MIRIRKILLPTDFSACASQAMNHAAHLARQYQAELHLLHVLVLYEHDPQKIAPHLADIEKLHDLLAEHAAARLDAAIRPMRNASIRIIRAQERAVSATDTILGYASDNEIDLIVMGTHGRRGARHFLLGSVAEKVVQLAPCPVLTIRERTDVLIPDQRKRILVPVDFSKHAENALLHAKEIGAACNATLQMLHVVNDDARPSFYGPASATTARARHDMDTLAREEMARLSDRIPGPEVAVQFHVVKGSSALAISRFAEGNKTDLIVIATHGLSGVWQFVMGSVGEAVVRTSPCPVLTLKAFGKSLVH